MSRSPCGSPCDSCKLCFDRLFVFDLMFVFRSCLNAFSIIARLIQPSSLLVHQEGPFSGCYWVISLEWPWIKWHSWRIANKLKWTAASFNNFFKHWREYKKKGIIHVCNVCLCRILNNECLQQQQLYFYPTLIYMKQKNWIKILVQATHNNHLAIKR